MASEEKKSNKHPVLFIHGAWHGAWCWDPWLKLFREQGYQETVAVELRGHGYNTASMQRARLEDYVEDVKRVIAELDSSPVLIGHSLGCTIIQHLCSQQEFPAVVLLAPIPFPKAFKKVFIKQMFEHPLLTIKSAAIGNMRPWVTSRISPRLFFSDAMPAAEALAYTHRMQGESFRLFMFDLLRTIPKPKRHTPTLLIAADQDAFFDVKSQQRTAETLGAEAILLASNSGHDIMLDTSSQQTAHNAIDWLSSR